MITRARISNFFVAHWMPLVIGFFFGLLVALPLSARWLGGVIPDGAGNLWGAGLGAAMAVVGAAWVEHSRRQSEAREFAVFLVSVFQRPRDAAYRVTSLIPSKAGNTQWNMCDFDELLSEIKRSLDWITRSQPGMAMLGYPCANAVLNAETALLNCSSVIDSCEYLWDRSQHEACEAGRHEFQIAAEDMIEILRRAITALTLR